MLTRSFFPAVAALVAAAVLAAAPAAAQDELPFITTPDKVTAAMLEVAGTRAGDFVLDLGSGDGRIVITAARRFGARGLGVEIVPDLVRQSIDNARRAGVADRAEFRVQDLFATDLAQASVITMYLLPEINLQLRPRLLVLAPGTRIVSHDWDLGDWAPDRTVTVEVPEKTIGREKLSRVHLWTVPARVQGLWCAADGAALEITQRFQRFSAVLTARGATTPALVFDGRIDTRTLNAAPPHAARLQLDGDALQMLITPQSAVAWAGQRFTRAAGAGCR